MTLPAALDRLVGSYYTDTNHYDAALKRFPDASGLGNHWPLVQNSGNPTFSTRGGMPCLDLFPQGGDAAFFQMPWLGYVDCSFIAAIRNNGTSGGSRSVLHAALAGDFIGEDYAGQIMRGDLSGTGQQVKTAVDAATTAALPTNTYSNGASGVGATLTATANGALAAQDGVTLTAGQRLLVKNEVAGANNGIYTLTQVGDATHPYILTRATDADTSAELSGALVKVTGGTTLTGHWFQLPIVITLNVGTETITWRDANSEYMLYDDAGFFVSTGRVPTVTGWNANGTIAGTALTDDTWTIVQGIWSADGWRRIRNDLNAWASSQSTATNRRIVTGGRLRMGWPVTAPISTVGQYCSIGEIHFVSDDLFVNQTETLDEVVTSLKTKYGIA